MRYWLLGPLIVGDSRAPVHLGGPRQVRVMAALLLHANNVVPVDRLVDVLWHEQPPGRATKVARNCVSLVRRALKEGGDRACIEHHGTGYRLVVPDIEVDARVFADLRRRAAGLLAEGREQEALAVLDAALSLWRGPALDGLDCPGLRAAMAGLDDQRLTTLETYVDLGLRMGNHAELLGPLAEVVAAHPLREKLVGYLMLTLYRSRRQADALATYRQLRQRLRDDLGVDPSPELATLHEQILRADPSIQAGPAAPAPPLDTTSPQVPSPAQLPAAIAGFVGRRKELAWLDGMAGRATPATPAVPAGQAAPVLCVLHGTAGVGKSALAVHWAHGMADRFPGGQLYVNLRGFDPSGHALDPADVLRWFLVALGVPAAGVPTTVDAQAAMYRSATAGKRMLIVLDNARDADHVRPLLPGAATTMTVVTSRARLASLVAVESAHPLPIDLPSTADCRELLARRLDETATPDTLEIERVINACARLPLALSVAAARARQGGFSLATIAAELREAGDRLRALSAGDPASDVTTVFSWSYAALPALAARLFRLIGLNPGPDISVPAAASLAGRPVPETARALDVLAHASLLVEHRPARYSCHDLLRAYAMQLSQASDNRAGDGSAAEPEPALHRLRVWYLHTAAEADRRLAPQRRQFQMVETPELCQPLTFQRCETAIDWCDAEAANVLAVAAQAAGTVDNVLAWQLPAAMWSYFHMRNRWTDLLASYELGLTAARHARDLTGEAWMLNDLGDACRELRRYDDGLNYLEQALACGDEVNDGYLRASILNNLAGIYAGLDRMEQALTLAEQALAAFRAIGDQRGEAILLNNLGEAYRQVGNMEQSLRHLEQARAVFADSGNSYGEGFVLDNLGLTHLASDRAELAVDHFHAAIRLRRGSGDRRGEASSLSHLGDALANTGRAVPARQAWRQAGDIFEDLGDPRAAELAAKLREPHSAAPRFQPLYEEGVGAGGAVVTVTFPTA